MINRRCCLIAVGSAGAVLMAGRAVAAGLPNVLVSKDPSCGCCSGWAAHLQAAGFPVDVREVTEMNRLKARLGVPRDLASCHTAEVDGYIVEGHVPADAIKRLLAERPAAVGLAVSGMPVGSPGMEVEGMSPETYEVVLFGRSQQEVFARYVGAERV